MADEEAGAAAKARYGRAFPVELLRTEGEEGIRRIAEELGLDEAEGGDLLDALALGALAEAPGEEGGSWLRRHALDLLVLALLVALGLLAWRCFALEGAPGAGGDVRAGIYGLTSDLSHPGPVAGFGARQVEVTSGFLA